jgi:ABC-type Na+ transport system ATPase subunit NatA
MEKEKMVRSRVNVICLMVNGMRKQSVKHNFPFDLELFSAMVEVILDRAEELGGHLRLLEFSKGKALLVSQVMESPHVVVWAFMDKPIRMGEALAGLDNFARAYVSNRIDKLDSLDLELPKEFEPVEMD